MLLQFDISGGGSVEYASARLLNSLQNNQKCNGTSISHWLWQKQQDYQQNETEKATPIVRIAVDCIADVENGAEISISFASNISNNFFKLPSDCPIAMHVAREGQFGLIGYGRCICIDSVERIGSILDVSHPNVVAVGGQSFIFSKSTVWGWLVPRIELRSSSQQDRSWPHVQLSVNLSLLPPEHSSESLDFHQAQDHWTLQLNEAILLLKSIKWGFRTQKVSPATQISPLGGEMQYSGMSEVQYLSAVQNAVGAMKSRTDLDVEDSFVCDDELNVSSVTVASGSIGSSSFTQMKSHEYEADEVRLEKVVYALRKTGQCVSPINAGMLLQSVACSNLQDNKKRFHFLYAPLGRSNAVFISLSPELLCRVKGTRIETEALAGTFPASDFDADVNHLAYLSDEKTSREHLAVSDYTFAALTHLAGGNEVVIEGREVLHMKDVVHFKQSISLNLPDDDSSLRNIALLSWATKNLHPTPAVCGVPTNLALTLIQRNERFDRGLYSSFCGLITPTGGELFVGLRSALVEKNQVHVYAGAGIVEGSVPASEWAEINLKMSQYIRVLTSMRRPAMNMEFANATAAEAAIVVEEMLRQGVGAFCVCPGSRSTPFAVAIYRNSVSRAITQVIHDERSAGFYAIGCARSGILCAVLVTSGTAVSNLFPAVSEARESVLPIILITADRPNESRDVGEAQTIRQPGQFQSVVGWERDFAPWDSEAPKRAAALCASMLSDISFAVGEVALRRNRVVHLNFQIRKSELEPDVVEPGFQEKFCAMLPARVKSWMASTQPYTVHCEVKSMPRDMTDSLSRWVTGQWRYWSVVVLAGELRSVQEALDLHHFCHRYQIPCIADITSMLQASDPVFTGMDRLCTSSLFLDSLSASVRVLIRVGGSLISSRLTDWAGQCIPLAKTIRVRDDGAVDARHDSTWSADIYLHGGLCEFLELLSTEFVDAQNHQQLQIRLESLSAETDTSIGACDALKVLRTVNAANITELLTTGSEESVFSEPRIARILCEELAQKPLFLSSSMVCRDVDNYSCCFANQSLLASDEVPLSGSSFHRIGCNRGANGIDGILSTAAGFADAIASASNPLTVLIGDVATLHDMSGIAIAAGCHPGSIDHVGKVGKIVCVNNSGGAIFSFLPAAKYKQNNDFFTPYMDTPHNIDISAVVAGLLSGDSVGDDSNRRLSVRVSNEVELRQALQDKSVFFIECISLPSHSENVKIHKRLTESAVSKIEQALLEPLSVSMHWTLHAPTSAQTGPESSLIVLLHGWLGAEADWNPFIQNLLQPRKVQGEAAVERILTVSTDCEMISPTLFCHSLRDLIRRNQLSICDRATSSSQPLRLLLIGYSQGGRLAMHYRHLFPQDVQQLACISTVAGKPLTGSVELERTIVDMWTASKNYNEYYAKQHRMADSTAVESFLNKWYSLPVFSNFKKRLPTIYGNLISQRINGSLCVDRSLRNMVRSSVTRFSKSELVVVGSLDSKYVSLAHSAKTNLMVDDSVNIRNCGHCILVEKTEDLKSILGNFLDARPAGSSRSGGNLKVVVCKGSVSQFVLPFQSQLVVLSNGSTQTFDSRKGLRIVLTVFREDPHRVDSSDPGELHKLTFFSGVGEVYEPVFQVGSPPLTYQCLVEEVVSVCSSLQQWEARLAPTAAGVASAVESTLKPLRGRISSVALYGFEQCLLHSLAQCVGISLVEAIGAYIGASSVRHSHVRINGFASMRSDGSGGAEKRAGSVGGGSSLLRPVAKMKLKVGGVDGSGAEADAQQVNDLVARIAGQRVRGWLRLDANQSWTVSQAACFAQRLSQEALQAIDYVEEPLRCDCGEDAVHQLLVGGEEEEVGGLRASPWNSIAVAFDESLLCVSSTPHTDNTTLTDHHRRKLDRWIGAHPDTRFVVKPSLLSLRSEFLLKPPGSVTISCTFESGGGLAFLVCVAAWFGDTHHGIHARADMVACDECTDNFSQLLKPALQGVGDGMEIAVWQAEQLLDDLAQSFLSMPEAKK